MSGKQAEPAIRAAVESCLRAGQRTLLIVHGTGTHSDPVTGPVLEPLVRQMLQGTLRDVVADYAKAPSALGGNGATLVFLKPDQQRRATCRA